MIQDLRENLKGTVAVVVGAVVLVAMVMTGEKVSKTSLSDSVASVNGDDISAKDLSRAMMQEKLRLKNQYGLPEDAEQLKDDKLRQPALASIMRQRTIVQAAERGGMGVSEIVIKDLIKQKFTYENLFNQQAFNGYLANMGFTQATLLKQETGNYIARQLQTGIHYSVFVTQKEIDLLAAIVGQKRTFSAVTIPKEKVAAPNLTENEIAQYYQDNQSTYSEPEKVSLQYLEVSVAELAKSQTVNEQEIKEVFEKELAEFKAEPELNIAHILIETSKNAAESDSKISEVQGKLKSGEAFDKLAKAYSDDLGSKELGGEIGVLTGEQFSADFKNAVSALNEGQVSGPLKSAAGTHFVKVLKKTVPVPPTLEGRKAAITQQLAIDSASGKFTDQLKILEEATFGKSDLSAVASSLSLKVQETELFSKQGAPGLTSEPLVLEAAFAKDVLEQGQVSKVLELPNERAVVIRLKEHQPSHVKPLAEVRKFVVDVLTQQKTAAQLQTLSKSLIGKLNIGVKPEVVSKELGYVYVQVENQDSNSSTVDPELLQLAFRMVRPAVKPQIESFTSRTGAQVVIILSNVVDGVVGDIDAKQIAGIKAEVIRHKSNEELISFGESQFASAKVKM